MAKRSPILLFKYDDYNKGTPFNFPFFIINYPLATGEGYFFTEERVWFI